MELMQLRFFCRAAATGSFVRAAEHFQVPPSSISHSIRRLEQELGAPLFDRTPNRVSLNAHGQLFYQGISQALDAIDQSTTRFTRDTGRRLKIGYSQGRDILERTFGDYTARNPGSDITIEKITAGASTSGFDIIVSAETPTLTEHISAHVLQEPMILCAAPNTLKDISIELLQEQPFITSSIKGNIYKNVMRICTAIGFSPKISLELQMTNLIPQYVSRGMGITILPYQSWSVSLRKYELDGWVLDGFYRDTYIYCRKQLHPHAQANQFLELLREHFSQHQNAEPPFPHLSF